jgi:dephospho-CoA kinase
VIVVYARQETMRARALARGGMTADKFDAVVAAQMPVADKLQRADLALDSDLLPDQTQQCLYDWLESLGHSCCPSRQQDN